MPLTPGTRLGPYEVTASLGAGGMGEVYKARDTRLDRTVAIKVLPAEKVADPERRRRFVQEAKAASALNHPHIITVHDIAQADGLDFIVMEHVDGKTLDAAIPRAGMRVSEVLKLGLQVAQALAAAHAKGIVHRDLKPANVMVAQDGTVKVLDFGLAKLDEPVTASETEAPTGAAGTGAGVILGTAAYMSPEQAEGKPVDARSDIFSFGAVLYEMATGRRAFAGDSWASTVSAVLSQEPKPLEGLPHDLEKVVLRCLRKDAAKRFQHMDDVCVAVEELKEESDSGKLGPAPAPTPKPGRRPRLAYGAAAAAVLLAAAGFAWRWLAPPAQDVPPPRLVPLTTFRGNEYHPAFSPDGKQVAFSWNGLKEDNYDIYVMLVGTSTPVRLTTDAAGDFLPAWSPDGRRIAFWRAGSPPSVMLMSALGGSERELAKGSTRTGGVTWSPDGKFVAFPADPETDGPPRIVLVSPDTGERRVATMPPSGGGGDGVPQFSPDGKSLAFIRRAQVYSEGIAVIPADAPAGAGRIVTPPAARVTLAPFAWTSDSRELVFSASHEGTGTTLWRMTARRWHAAGARRGSRPGGRGPGDRVAGIPACLP